MVASLNGVIFDQVYGDNSGPSEFDSDGDGTTTQEDEFVSFTNTSGAPLDKSGWQIWSDATGTNAPDTTQDGLYHTFAPDTVLAPGETIYVINEITGDGPYNAQEASEGGVESGAGGESSNYLSEGGTDAESVALVDPSTGQFLVFNMDDQPSAFAEFDGGGSSSNPDLAGFPGTSMVGQIDGHPVASDLDAGTSYQYNYSTGAYESGAVYISCFGADTWIDTPQGRCPITELRSGDPVLTKDNGAQPVLSVLQYRVRLDRAATHHLRPIAFKPGSLGAGLPDRTLTLSPQHRILRALPCGREVLSPAKGLLENCGVRVKRGLKRISYYHLLLPQHEVIFANGIAVESMFLGDFALRGMHPAMRLRLEETHGNAPTHSPARPFVGPSAMRRITASSPWPAM